MSWTGEQLFLKSADYFTAQQLYVGTRWVLTHGDRLQGLVAKLANRRELADAFAAAAGANVVQRTGGAVNGGCDGAAEQRDGDRDSPGHGRRAAAPGHGRGQALSNGLSHLKLNVSATAVAVSVTPPPAPYVDLGNLNTLPASFEQVAEPADSFRFETCDRRGCTLAVDFRNQGGRVGASSATSCRSRVWRLRIWCVNGTNSDRRTRRRRSSALPPRASASTHTMKAGGSSPTSSAGQAQSSRGATSSRTS